MSGRRNDQTEGLNVLSLSDVEAIVRRFNALNPYDQSIIPGLLKIEGVNFDKAGKLRSLRGLAISSKRYVLFARVGRNLYIIEPKAHGLGYLYPPRRGRNGAPPWHSDAWSWMLPTILGVPQRSKEWFDRPALMKVVVSTPNVLRKAARAIRPYNFVFYVLVDPRVGYPIGVDRDQFSLIMPFTKRHTDWLNQQCLNVYDGHVYELALEQTRRLDKAIPQTIGSLLRRYLDHVEAKSLAPDGERCAPKTRGLLGRDRIIASSLELVGKEADRRWQHGGDVSLMESRVARYSPELRQMEKAPAELIRSIIAIGIRETMRRTGLSQHTVEKVVKKRAVRSRTLTLVRNAVAPSAS